MFSFPLTNGVPSKPHLSRSLSPSSQFHQTRFLHSPSKNHSSIRCGIRELREQIDTVKNTQKITEAMKLVAAARVRRAQEVVVNRRPFSETLVEVLHDIIERLRNEDVDVPLTNVRPVKKVALVVITVDRGLCDGLCGMGIFVNEFCVSISLETGKSKNHLILGQILAGN